MAIQDLFSVPSGPYNALRKGMGQAGQQISAADEAAIKALMTGETTATGAFKAGMAPWATMAGESKGFLPLYAGALGAGGDPNAANAAFQKFWESTGSQADLNKQLEGLSRVGSSSGQLGALNEDTIAAINQAIQGNYGTWLQDLMGGVNVGERAAQGIQTGQTDIGKAALGTGAGVADIRQTQGSDLANLILGRARIPLQRQQAEQQAGANTLSLLFGLGGLGTQLAGAFNPPVTNIYGA